MATISVKPQQMAQRGELEERDEPVQQRVRDQHEHQNMAMDSSHTSISPALEYGNDQGDSGHRQLHLAEDGRPESGTGSTHAAATVAVDAEDTNAISPVSDPEPQVAHQAMSIVRKGQYKPSGDLELHKQLDRQVVYRGSDPYHRPLIVGKYFIKAKEVACGKTLSTDGAFSVVYIATLKNKKGSAEVVVKMLITANELADDVEKDLFYVCLARHFFMIQIIAAASNELNHTLGCHHLQKEYGALAEVKHENIVRFLGYCDVASSNTGSWFFVFEKMVRRTMKTPSEFGHCFVCCNFRNSLVRIVATHFAERCYPQEKRRKS